MCRTPRAGQIYKHFKGNLYQIVAVATHTETEEALVVYQALYGDYQVYARPLEMFLSPVDRDKYPDAVQEYRFELVPTVAAQTDQKPQEPFTKPQKPAQKETPNKTQEEAPKEAPAPDEGILEFLDADTYEERMRIFTGMQHRLSHAMIDTMAVVLDTEVPEGTIEERTASLKSFLQMQVKFECNRF